MFNVLKKEASSITDPWRILSTFDTHEEASAWLNKLADKNEMAGHDVSDETTKDGLLTWLEITDDAWADAEFYKIVESVNWPQGKETPKCT